MFSGVGKSSLINLLVGTNVAQTPYSVESLVFDIRQYPIHQFNFFDIPGYNSATKKNSKETLQELQAFANTVESNGISLIIYVMKKGRINEVSRKYYKYFVKNYCQGRVPVLLMITHCEGDKDMASWYCLNNKIFAQRGMQFNGVVSGCTSNPYNLDLEPELFQLHDRKSVITEESVMDQIEELALSEAWKPSNSKKWIKKALKLQRLSHSEPKVPQMRLYYIPTSLRGDKIFLQMPHNRS